MTKHDRVGVCTRAKIRVVRCELVTLGTVQAAIRTIAEIPGVKEGFSKVVFRTGEIPAEIYGS